MALFKEQISYGYKMKSTNFTLEQKRGDGISLFKEQVSYGYKMWLDQMIDLLSDSKS